MEPTPPPTHLFVYGTLRQSAANPMRRLLFPSTLIGAGTFPGKLYDLGNYPAAILSEDATDLVHGEVYRLEDPAATLAELDRYEACTDADPAPHEYVRTVLPIRLENGDALSAEVYLYNLPVTTLTPVPSGDYLRWLDKYTFLGENGAAGLPLQSTSRLGYSRFQND